MKEDQKYAYRFNTNRLKNMKTKDYTTSSYAVDTMEEDTMKHPKTLWSDLFGREMPDTSITRKIFSSGMARDVDENKLKPYLIFPKDIPYDLQLFTQINLPSNYSNNVSMLDEVIFSIIQHKVTLAVIKEAVQLLFDIEGDSFIDRIIVHYSNGAKKYEERNWEKGTNDIEVLTRYKESLSRHYNSWQSDAIDEDHAAAMAFNLAGIYHWILLSVEEDA